MVSNSLVGNISGKTSFVRYLVFYIKRFTYFNNDTDQEKEGIS